MAENEQPRRATACKAWAESPKGKTRGSPYRAVNAPCENTKWHRPFRVCFRLLAGAAECSQQDNNPHGRDFCRLVANAACKWGDLNKGYSSELNLIKNSEKAPRPVKAGLTLLSIETEK
jgi:hypothetical protein